MKLFGNKKRTGNPTRSEPTAVRPQSVQKAPTQPRRQETPPEQPRRQEPSGRMTERTKAYLLLVCSIALFFCAVIMCVLLVRQSAEAMELPDAGDPQEIKYYVNSAPPVTVDSPVDLEAPVSVNHSDRLNILLFAVNDETGTTDAVMLAGIDLRGKTLSLLSIPRDTYIAGNYEIPKLGGVYAEADDGAERGVRALQEQVKDMLGFWTDYYFALDEPALTEMTELTGGISFSVPDEPDYSALSSGTRTLNGADAMELLCYRSDYTDVETEPCRVQRELVLAFLRELLKTPDRFLENAAAIKQAARTDLSAEQLAYLAYLLADANLNDVFSRALPGGEITEDGVDYYEVDPEDAVEMLNGQFNPLDSDLSVYDVSFRQQTGESGEGEYDPYGFGHNSGTSGGNSRETESSDETDETEPDETEPDETEPTEDSEPTTEPEQPTEPEGGGEPSAPEPSETESPEE